MKIKFCGAVKTVTGSCHLITTEKYKVLLDCGQYQGSKKIDKLNFEPFPFNPEEIDFIILSHAHIDHSGRIPLLIKQGFKGRIYCTKATADLADILLKDSGYIHEKEMEWTNKKRLKAGLQPLEPLYTFADAFEAINYFEPVLYEQFININDTFKIRFKDAGHILGSSIVEIWMHENDGYSKTVFSGDLGMKNKPILRDPEIIEEADCLIMETTYGDRLHKEKESRIDILIDIILKTIKRGGTVVIPSFAVGRTQEILYELNKYYDARGKYSKELENVHVYVDSPLATSATEIFQRNAQVFDQETRDYILKGDNPLDFKNLHFTRSTQESKELNENTDPKVIISASGMCEAGRIKHHLKHHLWISDSSVVFVGYQAEGTLGRRIKDGIKDVKIFGEDIHINAEICSIEGFSGHADQNDLLDWLRGFRKRPERIFLVHGEADAKDEFSEKIEEEFGIEAIIAAENMEYETCTGEYSTFIPEDQIKAKPENMEAMSEDIYNIREALETSLYRISLSLNKNLTEEEYQKIKNKVLELEKDIINLSMMMSNHKIR